MTIGVVLLGFEGVEAEKRMPKLTLVEVESAGLNRFDPTQEINSSYAIYAIMLGLLAPIFFTIKGFAVRKWAQHYDSVDLGIDAQLAENLCYSCMFFAYLSHYEFSWSDLAYGCVVSIFLVVAKTILVVAYAEGPGGPINTILNT